MSEKYVCKACQYIFTPSAEYNSGDCPRCGSPDLFGPVETAYLVAELILDDLFDGDRSYYEQCLECAQGIVQN